MPKEEPAWQHAVVTVGSLTVTRSRLRGVLQHRIVPARVERKTVAVNFVEERREGSIQNENEKNAGILGCRVSRPTDLYTEWANIPSGQVCQVGKYTEQIQLKQVLKNSA